MNFFKFTFLLLILAECYQSTKAMGLCEFADKFPWEHKEGSICFKKKDQTTTATVTTATAIRTAPSCPANMVYANCTVCQGTCNDPEGCIRNCTEPETCVCPGGFLWKGDACVPEEECECFIVGVGVLPDNEAYVESNCSKRYVCTDGLLSCNPDYKCSLNATCRLEDGVRQCYCNEGYKGDGEICTPYADCYDAYKAGHRQDGVYTIFPSGWQGTPFNVSCDMTGGGWTIFQRRTDRVTNFTRDWESYKHGFGSVDEGRDFWLGNEQLFYLTNQRYYKLRINIINFNNVSSYAEYSSFRIGDESTNYKVLSIGSYEGNSKGNGMEDINDANFSTNDNDNDECDEHNCAQRHGSGWWHNPTNRCYKCGNATCRNFKYSPTCHTVCCASNLNGVFNGANGKNINWYYKHHCNPNFIVMKIGLTDEV